MIYRYNDNIIPYSVKIIQYLYRTPGLEYRLCDDGNNDNNNKVFYTNRRRL